MLWVISLLKLSCLAYLAKILNDVLQAGDVLHGMAASTDATHLQQEDFHSTWHQDDALALARHRTENHRSYLLAYLDMLTWGLAIPSPLDRSESGRCVL